MSEDQQTENYTYGDDEELPCPSCGQDICLTDYRIDGELVEWLVGDCGNCGEKFTVTNVDWSVTVTARKARPHEIHE